MKFLIANTDYSQFLSELYARQPGLSEQSFAEQLRIRYASRFGVADFYSRNLHAVGHEALDVYVNNIPMQRAWVKEFSATDHPKRAAFDRLIDRLWQETDRPIIRHARPLMRSWFGQDDEGCRILAAQVEHHRPDVFLNHAMDGIDSRWLKGIKPRVRLLVGQHAATSLPDHGDYSCYDLVVSSFPPTVEFFQRKGIPAVLHRLGFDPEVLLPKAEQECSYPVTFVGRPCPPFTGAGSNGFEQLCALVPELRIWGPGPICWTRHRRFAGVIWASCGGTRCATFSCVRRLHSIITATWPLMRTTAACSKRPAQAPCC